MPYIDASYYKGTYQGEPVDDASFPSLLRRAEEIVEEMTRYRLTESSMLTMPDWIQVRIKNAICAQIEYLDANGGADLDNGVALQSASLGKFNYSLAAGATGDAVQSLYSPRAQRILYPTGLLYRGGGA